MVSGLSMYDAADHMTERLCKIPEWWDPEYSMAYLTIDGSSHDAH